MRRAAFPIAALGTLLLAACQDLEPPTVPSAPPLVSISDGTHDGNPHFFWLRPLVRKSDPSGVFNADLSPVVQVCEGQATADGNCVGPEVARFTTTEGPGGEVVTVKPKRERYVVDWRVELTPLKLNMVHRVRVLIGRVELGHIDLVPEGDDDDGDGDDDNDQEIEGFRVLDTGKFIEHDDDDAFTIRFRIEQGAVFFASTGEGCEPDQICGEGTVTPEEGGLVTAQVSPGVDVAGTDIPEGAVNVETAIGIREVDCDLLPTGRKKAPPCFEYVADPPVEAFNVAVLVAMCFDASGLTPEEEERIALYKFDDGDPNVKELEHADETFLDCEEADLAAIDPNPLFRLVHSGWRAVQKHVSPWFSPEPLLAIDKGRGGQVQPDDGGFSIIGWAVERVLVYGPSLGPETTFRPLNEQTAAEEFGLTVDVVALGGEEEEGTWLSKSQTGENGFGDYDAIVFGEVGSDADLDDAGTAWSASVTGPAVITALHAWLHQCEVNQEAANALGDPGEGFSCLEDDPQSGGIVNRPQAKTFLRNAILWVTSGTETGLYVGLGTRYTGEQSAITLGFLSGIGDFGVIGIGDGPPTPEDDIVTIVAPDHPVMSGLSDAGLSGWFASVHEFFHPLIEMAAFPDDFGPLANGLRYTWLRDGEGNPILDEGGNVQFTDVETLPAIIARPDPTPPEP